MNKIYRKAKCDRGGRTVLQAAENVYMGANYRQRQGGGGGGGEGSVTNGSGPPVGNPGVDAAIYYDLNDGSIYKWDPNAADWDA